MIDVSQLEDFARRCEAAKADLKPYAGKLLEEMGEYFLDIVRDEIERCGNVDFGVLKASFTRYRPANVFILDTGALTLTVGTSVTYAKWVNEGHKQRPGRFVPGIYDGEKFRYVKGANTGIILKANKVDGSEFFQKSITAFQTLIPRMVESSFDQFFRRYFG